MPLETKDTPLSQLRVLVVDDNAALRGVLRISLQAFGCKAVLESSSVEHALDLLKSGTIDLLITDWKMSPKDGIDLVTALRNPVNSPSPFIPVIMLTAYSNTSHFKQARDAGVNEFLIKPFTAESLAHCINDAISDKRQFIQTDTFFGPDRRQKERLNESDKSVQTATTA
jgi:two-component system chemotaxis response regulator CheY